MTQQNFLLRMLKGKLTLEPYINEDNFKPKIPEDNIWIDETKWKNQSKKKKR